MRFKVEIEARLANLVSGFHSTLVFILKTRFRVIVYSSVFKELQVSFDH